MAVPFKLSPWQKQQTEDAYRRKNKTVSRFSREMSEVMRKAVDELVDRGSSTFVAPNLDQMFGVSERFYKNIVREAMESSEKEKRAMGSVRRLAALPKGNLPKNVKDFEALFRDLPRWRRLINRSKKLTERLKKQYLVKLRNQFNKVMPYLLEGEISPYDAKKTMVEVWETTKPRVETIFRTESTKYFAEAQKNFFEDDEEIIGFLFDSVKDVSRTEICSSRHGLIYRKDTKAQRQLLDENTPPCHYNCRSHLIPLVNTEQNRKLLRQKSRDPENVNVEPLPSGWR